MGFQDALTRFNLRFGNDQLVICDFSEKSCLQAAQQVIQRKELPDGIFIANDLCAAVCIQHFEKAGIRIPEDIAIIGFNNDVISRIVNAQLTTFHYPGYEMGSSSAEYLIDQLSSDILNVNSYTMVLKSEFIVRASSAGSTNKIISKIILQ